MRLGAPTPHCGSSASNPPLVERVDHIADVVFAGLEQVSDVRARLFWTDISTTIARRSGWCYPAMVSLVEFDEVVGVVGMAG